MWFLKSIVLFAIFGALNGQNNYCRLCSNHLACTRRNGNCGLANSCGRNARQIYLTNEDIRTIVDMHNSLRNKVALGRESTGRQPSATNMNALSYNKELAYIAQCLSNTCKFGHDKCRSTAQFSWVGQNLAIRKFYGTKGNYKDVIKSSIQSWYDEVKLVDRSWVSSYNDHGRMIGHYTQMVSANTNQIGCALTFFIENGWNSYLLACNYGPGGNYLGQPIYKQGKAASQCPGGRVNRKYPGLCGNDNY